MHEFQMFFVQFVSISLRIVCFHRSIRPSYCFRSWIVSMIVWSVSFSMRMLFNSYHTLKNEQWGRKETCFHWWSEWRENDSLVWSLKTNEQLGSKLSSINDKNTVSLDELRYIWIIQLNVFLTIKRAIGLSNINDLLNKTLHWNSIRGHTTISIMK